MASTSLPIAALLALSAPSPAPVSELEYLNAVLARAGLPPQTQAEWDQRKAYEAKWAREAEGNRLKGAGFAPAADLARQGRHLVRATVSEPRLFIRMPGVSLERSDTDGKVRVTLSSDGRAATGQAEVAAGQWDELSALEEAAFAPDPPPPPPPHLSWKRGDPLPAPQVVCHAWGTTLERIAGGRTERVSAHGCNAGPLTQARLAYAQQLAEVAVTAFSACKAATSPDQVFDALAACFGRFDPATSANP